jgi:hypothetical protein
MNTTEQLTSSISLLDAELLELDEALSGDPPTAWAENKTVQLAVDRAKQRRDLASAHPELSEHQRRFVVDVVAIARAEGLLIRGWTRVRTCACCGESDGYALRKRSSRKGLRGSPNYDRPRLRTATEYADRFVRVENHSSTAACTACVPMIEPVLIELLDGVRAQLPTELGGGKLVRYARVKCKCGWEGHEGELGKLPTLMGRGHYPGKCPSCKVEHHPLGRSPFERDGHVVVERSP